MSYNATTYIEAFVNKITCCNFRVSWNNKNKKNRQEILKVFFKPS